MRGKAALLPSPAVQGLPCQSVAARAAGRSCLPTRHRLGVSATL
jgi:hypothetical protein